MIDSYWDLYVAYVHHCVEWNKKHDIDPHHYEMEWNHFLPRCIFGNQPVGHYLLLKQHAIASALQTLAFKKNCMFGWHKHYLPGPLLDLSWTLFIERNKKNGVNVSSYFMKNNVGIFNPEFKQKIQEAQVKSGNEAVKNKTGIHDPSNKELVLAASRYALENQSGIYDPKHLESVRLNRVNNGTNALLNQTGIFSSEYAEKHSEVGRLSGSQRWMSTVDGYTSNAPRVASHNKRNGWDPNARIRIS